MDGISVVCVEENIYKDGYGMVGLPDLEDKHQYNDDWGIDLYTFGWVYAGLNAIHFITEDVEANKIFLEKYNGKTIRAIHESDDESAWDGVNDDELVKYETESVPDFVECKYRITNDENGKFIETDTSVWMREITCNLKGTDIDVFLSKLDYGLPNIEDTISSYLWSIDQFDFFQNLLEFIKENKNGELVVSIKKS